MMSSRPKLIVLYLPISSAPDATVIGLAGNESVKGSTASNAVDAHATPSSLEIESNVTASSINNPVSNTKASPSAPVEPIHVPSDHIDVSPIASVGPTPAPVEPIRVPSDHIDVSPIAPVGPTPAPVEPIRVPSDHIDVSPIAPVGPTLAPAHRIDTSPSSPVEPTHAPLDDMETSPSTRGVEPLIKPIASPSSTAIDNSNATDTATQMDVDVDDEDAPDSAMAPPTWLRDSKMPDYLRGISKEKAWQELITSLFVFEALNTTTGVCLGCLILFTGAYLLCFVELADHLASRRGCMVD